ncbi:MAG: DUF1249 domain-containing protein [Gammaproteobacteria bacterium]
MELTATKLPADLLRPRSLAMLMGIYETNYRRLLELLGDPGRWSNRFCLRLSERPILYVEVRDRARYTVDIVLTYRFDSERLPDLAVRLYRDARLAEALPIGEGRPGNGPFSRLPARWRANLLLYKWLEYSLDAVPGDMPSGAVVGRCRESEVR